MNKSDFFDKIIEISRKVRSVSCEYVSTEDAVGCDYYKPNSPSDNNLSCFCACASVFLSLKLNENKIRTEIACGFAPVDGTQAIEDQQIIENHTWVKIKNYIIDITPTQFNSIFPNIDDILNKKTIVFEKETMLPSYQEMRIVNPSANNFRTWPITQRPYKKVIDALDLLYEIRW
jgi:hypothetical protein